MQETIKVIKEALNKNSNELYELNQQKENTVRVLVGIQTEIYQKEERQAKLQQELNQLRDINDNECLKKADLKQPTDAGQRPSYNDNSEKIQYQNDLHRKA
jgi:hypothetical protein